MDDVAARIHVIKQNRCSQAVSDTGGTGYARQGDYVGDAEVRFRRRMGQSGRKKCHTDSKVRAHAKRGLKSH